MGGNKIDESLGTSFAVSVAEVLVTTEQEKNREERAVKEKDGMKKNSKPNNEKLA